MQCHSLRARGQASHSECPHNLPRTPGCCPATIHCQHPTVLHWNQNPQVDLLLRTTAKLTTTQRHFSWVYYWLFKTIITEKIYSKSHWHLLIFFVKFFHELLPCFRENICWSLRLSYSSWTASLAIASVWEGTCLSSPCLTLLPSHISCSLFQMGNNSSDPCIEAQPPRTTILPASDLQSPLTSQCLLYQVGIAAHDFIFFQTSF